MSTPRYRALVLAVYDPRWFMKVLDRLKARRIPYTLYYTPDNIPYYSVLYTDYKYFIDQVAGRKDLEIVYDPEHQPLVLEKAILRTKLKETYNEIIVGVDPGPSPYIIVLGDSEILEMKRLDPEAPLAKEIERIKQEYPYKTLKVRVGQCHNGWRIAYMLKKAERDIAVEIVDEAKTTPKNGAGEIVERIKNMLKPYRNKDAYAALSIALRKGIEVIA